MQIGTMTLDLNDPVSLALLIAAALGLLIVILLIAALRGVSRAAQASEPLIYQMDQMGRAVDALGRGRNS